MKGALVFLLWLLSLNKKVNTVCVVIKTMFWVVSGVKSSFFHATAQITCRPPETSLDGYLWFIPADTGWKVAE